MSKNETLNLEVFDNPEFGQMRILREGDKYLFCANDAAVALGYSNPRAALQRHCKGVAKRDTLTPGGVQSLSYIAEGDLYRLIIHSKLPSAEMRSVQDVAHARIYSRVLEMCTPILLQGADRRKSISNGKRILAKQILFPQKEVLPHGKTE